MMQSTSSMNATVTSPCFRHLAAMEKNATILFSDSPTYLEVTVKGQEESSMLTVVTCAVKLSILTVGAVQLEEHGTIFVQCRASLDYASAHGHEPPGFARSRGSPKQH